MTPTLVKFGKHSRTGLGMDSCGNYFVPHKFCEGVQPEGQNNFGFPLVVVGDFVVAGPPEEKLHPQHVGLVRKVTAETVTFENPLGAKIANGGMRPMPCPPISCENSYWPSTTIMRPH